MALRTLPFAVLLLCVLCGETSFAQPQLKTQAESERHRYEIQLTLDFDKRTYTGTERVRFVNRGTRATSTLYFHLYSNLRVPGYFPPKKTESGEAVSDEPRLEVLEVRTANTNAPVPYTLEDQDTTLRVNLRELIAPRAATEVVITFKGSVPEIDPEETGLVAHVMQQVSAAIGSAREMRRARGINFRCRGVLLLGSWYPVLAARAGDDWLRRMEPSIGDSLVTDVADYQVTIDSPQGVSVFTPVEASNVTSKDGRTATTFSAESLRDFVVVAGSNMRAEQRVISGITIRSIYRNEHETAARRALNIAADAVNVYVRRIGPLPLRTISLVDAPLVATLSNAEFSGFAAIASAFYLDFDSPSVSSMPDIIREQRASVEESLEWTVAHVVAHQWWGTAVGNDPSREPVLDEALANWSALLYYREVHGEKKAEVALEEQLRGVYKLYRTFGGEDMEANRAAREYRNSFQYAAIVIGKGALLFEALRKMIGDEKFFAALAKYYAANRFEVAQMDDLRGAVVGEASVEQRRTVSRTFDRWLSSKNGDEDIAPPDPKLAAELGLPVKDPKTGGNVFSRVGRFFWQQMTRIR
ncbi:MAG TPA: M1 family aminopeptidase [Pyrinomonadaceae bacterium]|nr:M1 family aminopeptidase [Pyrinomonadaceae bacterium]